MTERTEQTELKQLISEMVGDLRMSGASIAAQLGVSRATVSRWGSGVRQPDDDALRDLWEALSRYQSDLAERMNEWEAKLLDLNDRGVIAVTDVGEFRAKLRTNSPPATSRTRRAEVTDPRSS